MSEVSPTPYTEAINLLGPFLHLTKVTGLDGTPGRSKVVTVLQYLGAVVVIGLLIVRTVLITMADAKILSFGWAECNLHTALSIVSIVCAFCIFGWTKSSFIHNHLERLDNVRQLRNHPNPIMDRYTRQHLICASVPLPWLGFLMGACIYNFTDHKILYGGNPTLQLFYIPYPILTVLAWLVISICLIYYVLVQISIDREMDHFNKEMETAIDFGRLEDPKFAAEYSYRHNEILKLLREANKKLSSLVGLGLGFNLAASVFGIYIANFLSVIPIPYLVCILGSMNGVIGITVIILKTAGSVQEKVAETRRILMNSCFEKYDNVNIIQIMIDRAVDQSNCLTVLGIRISASSAGSFMQFVPLSATALLFLRNILRASGLDF